jgi:hypothetical protein
VNKEERGSKYRGVGVQNTNRRGGERSENTGRRNSIFPQNEAVSYSHTKRVTVVCLKG